MIESVAGRAGDEGAAVGPQRSTDLRGGVEVCCRLCSIHSPSSRLNWWFNVCGASHGRPVTLPVEPTQLRTLCLVILLGCFSPASVGNVAGVARERGWCRQQVWDCALLGVNAGNGRTSDRSGSRVGLGLVRYCPRRCRSWGWRWGLCWSCSFPLDRRGSVVAVLGARCGASAACAIRLLLRVPRGWLCLCVRGCCASVLGT